MMAKMEDRYRELYSTADWEDEYKNRRFHVYDRILRVLMHLPIRSMVDVGASYGLLVEICNENGLDAYGVEFPVANLIEFHATLKHSKNKFFYGSIEESEILDQLSNKSFDAVVVLDSFRYFRNPALLNRINPIYFIIKEICDNKYIRRRRHGRELDVRLYSPLSCSELFPDYRIARMYMSKHVASIRNPPEWMLSAYNDIFPTYTLVLVDRDN